MTSVSPGYSDDSDDDGFTAAPAAVPAKDACVVEAVAPRGVVTEHSWSVHASDALLHFQAGLH